MSEPCAICQEKLWRAWAEREAYAGRPLPRVARACEECKRKMAAWWGRQQVGGEGLLP